MSADLHIHTNCSDGTQSPEKVVELAKEAGLKTIAITDHDTFSGIAEAKKKAHEIGLEIIPGIELTTEDCDTEVHILGYFIDVNNPDFLAAIEKIQTAREERIYKICDKLKGLGVDLDPQKVFALAGHKVAGRPHVARALIEAGYVDNFNEAFKKYLDFHGPAYVSHYKLLPKEAIKLIVEAGGLAVFGHPAVSNCDQIIPDLVEAGLAGLEVYYIRHRDYQVKHYLELAKKYGLLETGGSDYHGIESGREVRLGDHRIPNTLIEKLKHEHARRNQTK